MHEKQEHFSYYKDHGAGHGVQTMLDPNFSLEKAMSAVGPWNDWSWVGRWGFTQFVGTGDGVWHLSVWEFPAR